MAEEMSPLFKFHKLNDGGQQKAIAIAEAFNALKTSLNLAPGRESSIVFTKLEEACFFAKKAMATQPENQAP